MPKREKKQKLVLMRKPNGSLIIISSAANDINVKKIHSRCWQLRWFLWILQLKQAQTKLGCYILLPLSKKKKRVHWKRKQEKEKEKKVERWRGRGQIRSRIEFTNNFYHIYTHKKERVYWYVIHALTSSF